MMITTSVLENCRVSAPPAAVSDTYLPLTFYDVFWLIFSPLSRILFYDYPCSKTKFTQIVVPNLKHSLSLALKHFFPLAGNLIIPPNISTTSPQIRYVNGDSVSLTIAECSSHHFNHLSGNHVRDADDLFPLVPQPAQGDRSSSNTNSGVVSPVLALQVTLFPDHGISIGITSSHAVADGSTIFNFVKAWASFAKHLSSNGIDDDDDDDTFQMPFYDRNVIKDPKGLDAIYKTFMGELLEQMQKNPREAPHPPLANIHKVRSTFFMYRTQIQVLKDLVFTKLPNIPYVSSITVVCAYLWTCIAKTRAAVGEGMQNEDEPQHFGLTIDCRSRLDPPIPASYFGNCLMSGVASGRRTELVGQGGFYKAVELIWEAVHNKVNNKEGGGVLKDAEFIPQKLGGLIRGGEWMMGVAGSPNFDYYNAVDFGFGKAKKFEFVSEPLSLSRCRDSDRGDMEIGLQLPRTQMDVFRRVFASEMQDMS